MAKSGKVTSAPARRALKALEGIRVKATKVPSKEVVQAIVAADLESYTGSIAYAGASANAFLVQFNSDAGGGYASSWPEWAYDIASKALLHGKKLWLITDGEPFGMNLLQVLMLDQSI